MLNDQVKKGGVMASSYVGGLSGAFIPVSEDQGMIDAVNAGSLTLEETGGDDLCLLGGTGYDRHSGKDRGKYDLRDHADEMAIGMVNQKTTQSV